MTRALPLACLLLVAGILAGLAGTAQAGPRTNFPLPPSSERPEGFRIGKARAIEIARRSPEVTGHRGERRLRPRVSVMSSEPVWRISFLDGSEEVARVSVDGRTGRVTEAWSGPQLEWPIARGLRTAFRDQLEVAMLVLCVLFVLPFVQPRRPLGIFHLDLLAFVAFMVSFLLFDRGHVYASVPLQYPPLLYLLARLLWVGLRGAARPARGVAFAGDRVILAGVVALVVLRALFNLELGRVGDVGYAGVFGADSIHHGWPLYTVHPTHLDTYGPVNYLLYLPFEALFPFDVGWQRDSLAAAHSAAIVFDLVVVILLATVGRRLEPGAAGRRLGLALAYLWLACPFTFLPLAVSANDAIVPAFVLGALLMLGSPVLRGALLGLGGAAKFAPLALLPLFALAPERSARKAIVCVAAGAGVFAAAFAPHVADLGLSKVWDSTVGFQLTRESPFTPWGLHDSLSWLHVVAQLLALAVVAAAALARTGHDVPRVAALAAAVILATQMAGDYWAHTYVAWFAAPAFVALAASQLRVTERARQSAGRAPA